MRGYKSGESWAARVGAADKKARVVWREWTKVSEDSSEMDGRVGGGWTVDGDRRLSDAEVLRSPTKGFAGL